MSDILHRIGITATPDEVVTALTTTEGLAAWWTETTSGDPTPGGVIAFRFAGAPDLGGFDMEVLEVEPGRQVRWKVVDGPSEWVGTTVRFDLKEEDGFTIVLFAHEGWTEPGEFMSHCSTRWAAYLMSLKQMVETGTGQPSPREMALSNWT